MIKNTLQTHADNQYLFILSQAYSGSTLLHKILSSSPQVSPLNTLGTREGFGLQAVQKHIDFSQIDQSEYELPWHLIKRIYHSFWDRSKALLLDKNPSYLYHWPSLIQQYSPHFLIVLTRDPYVLAKNFSMRNDTSLQKASTHTIASLRIQKRILDEVPNSILLRYEDLTLDPKRTLDQLHKRIPALTNSNFKGRFKIHNASGIPQEINNMNAIRLKQITLTEWSEINTIFQTNTELLERFNYGFRTEL